jgi:hypothetical protein
VLPCISNLIFQQQKAGMQTKVKSRVNDWRREQQLPDEWLLSDHFTII